MQLDLLKNLEQYTKRNRRRSIWRKIVRFLACIVVFCTTYALILPALTMEQPTFCNHEEHVHTEDCYIQLDASANLICTPEVHTHNELCFDELGNIICGVADYLGHTHTEECYGEDGTLICTIPETVWHVHDESCLVPAQPKLICGITEGDIHFHDDSCYTINITINNNQIPTEDIAHVHSVVCYDELGNLICGLEGSVYHVHGTECYDEFGTLICLLEETAQETGNNDLFSTSEYRTLICTLIEGEGHGHTELCYEAPETEFILGCACNIPTHTHNELCFDEFGNIICGMSENIAHIHDSVYCYDANGNLVCPLLETAVHVHTAECFAAHEQPLTCGLEENEEHTHSKLCYGTWQFICTAEEHTHDLACYSDPSADVETAQDWEEMLSSVSLTGVWADDVVEIAKSQIGYVESELNYAVSDDGVTPLGYTRYGEWFGVPYDEDWSAAFASFCLSYAKVEGMAFDSDCAMWVETLSAGWQDLYRNANEYTPVRGDLVFFDTDGDTVADRVGILAEIAPASENAPETLLVIEGDCFNQVQYMTYGLGDASIIGYSMLPEQEPLANTYDYFDGIVDVKVEIPADSGIPEDAVLRVTPIDVTDSNYLNLLASAEVAVDGTLSRAQFYDISFYTADLEYIPVGETARVTMRFAEGVITPNADTLVLHYEDNESTPTVIEGVSISQEIVLNASTFNVLASVIETTETVLTFETDGFSVFGVVEVETYDGEIVDVYNNPNGYTDLISADPWEGFGVGTSTPSRYSVGTISIEEIREIVANGGATYNMIFSGTPSAGPQAHFSAWGMPIFDENGNYIPATQDDINNYNSTKVTIDGVETDVKIGECELDMALTQLSNGKYLATVDLDELLDLFTSGKFGTKTIDDITNLTVQIYTKNFVLYDAWFEIPDTCDNLENGIETDVVKSLVTYENENIQLFTLPEPVNTSYNGAEPDTIVVHVQGTTESAFRTWLCNGVNNHKVSVQETFNDVTGKFDLVIEYTANDLETNCTDTVANYVQFKGLFGQELVNFNLSHVGVFYGTMEEYEAAVANGGIITPPEEALLTDCTLEDDIAETKQYYDNDTIILYTLPTPLEFNSDQKTVVVHFTGTSDREFRTWLCNSSSNTLSSVQYSHSVDNGEIHADGTFDIIKEYVFSTNTEGNNTQAAYFEFKGTSGNTSPLSDLNISHVGVFYGTMEEYQARAKENLLSQTVQLFKSDSAEGSNVTAVDGWRPVFGEGNVTILNGNSANDLNDLNISLETLIEYAQQDDVTLHFTYSHSDSIWGAPCAHFNTINTGSVNVQIGEADANGLRHASISLSNLLNQYISENNGSTDGITGFGVFGNAPGFKLHEVWLEGVDEVIIEDIVRIPDDPNQIFELDDSITQDKIAPVAGGILINEWTATLTTYANGAEEATAKLKEALKTPGAKIKLTYTGDAEPAVILQSFDGYQGIDYYDSKITTTNVGGTDYKIAVFDCASFVEKYENTTYTNQEGVQVNHSLDRLCNFSLAGNNNVVYKIEVILPEAKPVTNLDGQIAVIVGVNNENDVYPAIASSPSNGSTNLVGANLDSFVIGADGKPSINDNDYASNIESNRIVWQFIAEGEPGSYYIKASNYYNDNGVANNAYAGYYLNITSTGLTLSETPQAIEVVSYETLDAKSTINDVVCLRVKENDTYYYVNLNGNDGNNDFQVGTLNEDNRASHLVIVDTLDEEVLELRDLIDQLPTNEEFIAVEASLAHNNNSSNEVNTNNYNKLCNYRADMRKIALEAKAKYDELVATSDELALDKNLVGYDRLEKLLKDLEWLWRPAPNVVPAVDLNATVRVFNYDPTVNNYILDTSATNQTDGTPIKPHYAFYNWSNAEKSEDGYHPPSGGDADRPVISTVIGSNGYPVITEIRTVVGKKQDTNEDGTPKVDNDGNPVMVDIVENVVINNNGRELDYLFAESSPYHKGTMNDGGGLFQQDADGYYYYYSDTNAAYFNGTEFVLYDVVVRPENQPNEPDGSLNTMQSLPDRVSNFLPFNPIVDENGNSLVMYDHLVEGDQVYYEVPSSEDGHLSDTTYINGKTDLWFGMNIEFDFFIPEGAKVNGKPMEFDFHGDDDVFVYIDDILVLDIGGCHAALDGNINFETGRVYYQTNEYGGFEDTTLGEIFRNAGKSEEYLKANFEYDEATGKYTTFKDFSTHNLKFFYMERGGSISYCGIRFNLPSIPEYDLMIGKELVDNTGKKIESDYDYTFRVVKKDDPTQLFLPANTPFDIYDNGTVVGRGYIDANGLFTLKAGQVAVFPTISGTTLGGSEYIVQELMPEDVDEMYGRIEYRTDGTPGGIIKNTETTVMQVLSFYNKLLYGNANARAGEDLCTDGNPHSYAYDNSGQDLGDGTHSYKCNKCQQTVIGQHKSYNYNYDGINGHIVDCYICGYKATENHVWSSCQIDEHGIHTISCSICNYSNNNITTVTDNQNGTHTISCSACDSIVTSLHIANDYWGEGDNRRCHCVVCGKEVLAPENATTPEQHNHSYTSSVTTEATCGTDGVRTYTCSCGHSYTEAISATGNHNVTNWTKVEGSGTHTGTCTACGETVTQNHTWGTPPQQGWYDHKYTCTLCGETKLEVHDSVYEQIPGDSEHHRATCTICSGSADVDHEYSDWVVTTQPTATTEGTQTRTCSECGYVMSQAIPATGVQGPETVTINGTTYLVYPTDDLNLSNNDNNNKATSVVVTNTMTIELGTLKITKTGASEQDEVFNMQVLVGSGTIARATLVPLTAGTEYKVNGETRYVGTNGIIQLKLNETAVIEGFAPGTFVEVIEILGSGQDYTPSYSGSVEENYDGSIDSVIGENGTAIIGEGDTVHLTVNNAKNNARVEIPLEKTVPVHQSSATQFRFAIKQVDENGNPINNAAHIDDVSLTASWSTPSLGSVVIGYENPVTGTYYYKVTEYNDGQNFFYDDTEYIVTVRIDESHNAKITNIKRDGNEYYNGEGEVPALSFLNYQMSELTVSKTVVGSDTSGEFKFRVEIRGIDDRYNFDTICGDLGFTKGTDDLGNTVYYKEDITLSHGESTELLVPMWSTVRVIETDSLGCSVSNTVINGGQSITAADDKCEPFTVDVSGAAVAFTNVRGIELPHTGGPGIYLYASGGMLLLAIFAVLLYNKTNCRKEGRASS